MEARLDTPLLDSPPRESVDFRPTTVVVPRERLEAPPRAPLGPPVAPLEPAGLGTPRSAPRRPPWRWTIAARFGVFLLLASSLVQHSCVTSYLVSGNSMLPNYADGDRVVVARMPAMLDDPSHGDTVIARVQGEIVIKRIMGLPGELIEIEDGVLCRGGIPVDDPIPNSFRRMRDMDPIQLGQDEYFLLGDHRRVSIDSREFGPVSRVDILGRVVMRFSGEEEAAAAAVTR